MQRRPPNRGGLSAFIYSDYTVAAVLIAFCAFTYYLTTLIDTVPVALAQGMQPASYPQGVLVFILLFIGGMLIESRSQGIDVPEPVPGLAYYTAAAMIVSLVIATWVDFFLGMIAFVLICVPLWGIRRYFATAIYAVVLAVILYLMFATFLRVRFPSGILIDLLS